MIDMLVVEHDLDRGNGSVQFILVCKAATFTTTIALTATYPHKNRIHRISHHVHQWLSLRRRRFRLEVTPTGKKETE